MEPVPTLHFFCGKMAAGKTTLARQIAAQQSSLLLSEDLWLSKLYPNEIQTFDDYIQYSRRLKGVLASHVESLLSQGLSVVMDFPGNVPIQRDWFRTIFEAAQVNHVLHYLIVSDERCKLQLQQRNTNLPEGSMVMSEMDFDHITSYFRPPLPEEGFNIIQYHRG